MVDQPKVGLVQVLFNSIDFPDFAARVEDQVKTEIDAYDSEQVVLQPMDQLLSYFTGLYEIPTLHLDLDRQYAWEPQEMTLRIPGDILTMQAHDVHGTRIVVAIPYSGQSHLLGIRPNRPGAAPRAALGDGELLLVYEERHLDANQLQIKVGADVARLSDWTNSLNGLIGTFNSTTLHQVAGGYLSQRRDRLTESQDVISQLGLPVKRRADADKVEVPTVRRRVEMPPPVTPTSEPFLEMEIYEAILHTIANARNALERSPTTWAGFEEEDIRNVLLLFLNGTFEGQAVGEVFNGAGKTDILMRSGDRNVFIAECKFWDGPKSCLDAVDQLLSYLVWRDTKAALFLFVTRKDVSAAIDKAIEVLSKHSRCEQVLESTRREDRQDFIFTAPDDAAKKIRLALLIFVLPRA